MAALQNIRSSAYRDSSAHFRIRNGQSEEF